MTVSEPRLFGREYSSFRDPAGYLFWRDGSIYRHVMPCYQRQFEAAQQSGLYAECIAAGLLLPFEQVDPEMSAQEGSVAVLKPRQLALVTYPYEWSFTQLKDAAIVTLELHLAALKRDMVLKDASAYNVQFVDGRPCFIDHLSFDFLADHGLWPAYGQFCRHFLAPLALMAKVDLGLARLLQLYLDGVPLDLAAKLLPWKTRLSFGLYAHLHLHAKMIGKHAGSRQRVAVRSLPADRLAVIAQSLLSLVRSLKPAGQATEWGDYYADTNYVDEALEAKKEIVRELVSRVSPRVMWDIGGNNGHFSRAVRDLAGSIVCMDLDPIAVDQNYALCGRDDVTNVMPLLGDVCNPSPGIGFSNKERTPLKDRSSPDLIMGLALIHHLAISNNLPFAQIARDLSERSEHVIIEFVPKSDSQVERLLLNRRDVFDDYTEDAFRSAFAAHFDEVARRPIPGSQRSLYLLRRRGA